MERKPKVSTSSVNQSLLAISPFYLSNSCDASTGASLGISNLLIGGACAAGKVDIYFY